MNRIYNLVFNHALRQVQVVSEHARRQRGSTAGRSAPRRAVSVVAGLTVALALAAAPSSALAQSMPTGGQIRGGIENIYVSSPNEMVIDQGNHLRGVIDWASFDIGAGNTVRFDQLADAVALNVIGDVNPSQIYGNLEATGTVFLVNPNGIIFGGSASVNVGGLIASTLEVDGNVFLDGGDGIAMTSRGIPASITNAGTIVATGMQGATLLGGYLSNTGVIRAELGSINLLGTQTATLSFGAGNRWSIAVGEALTTVHNEPVVVRNNGELHANAGRVYLHANVASGVLSNAVNHAGIITATGIDADGNGGVVLSGGGSGVVQSGSITSGADALIAAEGAVSLDGDSLDVTGLTVDAGSLDIESGLDLDGNLSITVADGGISQSGAWQVGGTSTLDAGSGQIRLDNAGNDFLGTVNLTGGEVSIQDKNALGLGALDVGSLAVTTQSALGLGSGVIGGNLRVDSNGGNITQSTGGLQVGGTSVLDAGLGGISLGQAGNRFDGSVQLSGHAVTIASDFDLDLGPLDVGSLGASSGGSVTFGGGSVNGSLGVTSGGDISQTGAITVGGVSTLVAQDGSITLADSGNDFAGVVNLDSDGAAEIGSAGTLTLGTVNARSLDASSTDIELHEDIQTGGDQRYAGAVRLAADVALASGAGDVAFEGSVDGTHALTVEAAAGAATFGGPVGTTTALASLTADAGSVSIGNRLVVFGDLALTAATGGIAQGAAWQVGGTGMLDAGTDVITLTQVGNDFVGAVHLAGGDVSIQDVNALTLGTLDVGTLDATSVGALNLGSGGIDGNLVAQSNNGAITQSGALDITGTSTLNAGTGSIALADGINRFGGAVTATGNGITLVGQEDLAIAGLTFQPGPGHGIRLEAGGTLTLPGESIDTGPAGLILASKGGELATAATLRGANVSLTGADGIHLGHDVVAPTVTLHSGASISQAGGVLQMDSLHLNAGGSVSLDAENQMAELGDVDVGGNFSLRNVPAIRQAEETSVAIDGDASFSSGGAITLANAGNRFGGEVGLSGGAAEVSAADGLRLGDLDVVSLVARSGGTLDLGRGEIQGNLEATSNDGIAQSGALLVGGTSALDAGTGSLVLAHAGNDFVGAVDATGAAITISDTNALTAGTITGTADVRLQSGGAMTLENTITGNRIDLATTDRFVNNAGAGALTAGDSWRVYLASPDDGHQFGGLDSNNTALWNTAAFGPVGPGNRYVFAYQPTLTFSSVDVTKTYGQAIELANSYTVAGLMDGVAGAYIGDTLANVVTGTPTLDSVGAGASATVAGGPYGIDISAGSVDASGSAYDLRFESTGVLTVDRAALTVTASDAAKTYGEASDLIGYTVEGLLNDDAVSGADLTSTGSVATANVGDYIISVDNASGTGLDNYDITYVDGVLTVGKAGLVIRANDGGKTYGEIGGLAGYAVEGLLNDDAVSGADLTSTGSVTTANVGDYVITVDNASGTGLDNYAITYVDGVLTIGKAGLVIRANDARKTIGQEIALDSYAVEGLVNNDAVTAVDLSSSGTASLATAGTYTIVADNAVGTGLDNYEIVYLDGTLHVVGADTSDSTQIAAEVVASLPPEELVVPPAGDAPRYRIDGPGLQMPPRVACEVLMPESAGCPPHSPR